MNDADVVVVGCGPVGVMAALRCAQRGLRVIAIDRSAEVYPLPRAIGMDDEVQDLFARAGLLAELRQHSTPMLGVHFVDGNGAPVVEIERPADAVGPLGHPSMVAFDQPSVERFLREAAQHAGVELRLGVEATAIESTADGVTLYLENGATVTGRWLIGADGARSTIRQCINVELIDQQFDQTWLVVDTMLLDPDLALPALPTQHCSPERIVTFVPGHHTRRRWEFQLRPHETQEEASQPEFLARMLDPWGRPDQLQVDRSAVYRFHATVADRFRAGPVFLVGDAAHQMPPFNGQGMCTGMRDAENLSWKLADVAAGRAGSSLLDTYDAERRPHATSQVAHSVDTGQLMEAIARDGEAALQSGHGLRRFPKIAHGIIDGDHQLVGMPLPHPVAQGVELNNGWTLLHLGTAPPEVPKLWAHLQATVHSIDANALGDSFRNGDTIVVRPDRFIAAVTQDLAATTHHLAPLLSG